MIYYEYDYLRSGIGNLRTRRIAPFPAIAGAISSPLFRCKKVILPWQKCLKIKVATSFSLTWPPIRFCPISTLYQSEEPSKEDFEVLKMWHKTQTTRKHVTVNAIALLITSPLFQMFYIMVLYYVAYTKIGLKKPPNLQNLSSNKLRISLVPLLEGLELILTCLVTVK